MKIVLLSLAALSLVGCATTNANYVEPTTKVTSGFTKKIAKPKDEVWDSSIVQLGQRFFVINNLEKASGLLSVSYSGRPESFTDCGIVTVENKGAEPLTLPAATADVTYQRMMPSPPYGIMVPVQVHRQMRLAGRMNIMFQTVDNNETLVTIATRYVMTRSSSANGLRASTDDATFNGNEVGAFPIADGNPTIKCVATGDLERQVLEAIQ